MGELAAEGGRQASQAKRPELLDFFIIGVQKGGTTALDAFLKRNPCIEMAASKELHFFDDETIDWLRPDYSLLARHFDWTDERVKRRGEATPIYIYWPNAIERLQRYNPSAKLIVCLRHPVFRAYSHWRMETKRGAESLSFEEAVSDTGRTRVRLSENGVHRVFSYIERGFYAEQIMRLLAHFPRQQTLFLKTEDLWLQPADTVGRVYQFLCVDGAAPANKEYIVPIDTSDVEPVDPKLQAALLPLFRRDAIEVERLTGLDLSAWFERDYREPMTRLA